MGHMMLWSMLMILTYWAEKHISSLIRSYVGWSRRNPEKLTHIHVIHVT